MRVTGAAALLALLAGCGGGAPAPPPPPNSPALPPTQTYVCSVDGQAVASVPRSFFGMAGFGLLRDTSQETTAIQRAGEANLGMMRTGVRWYEVQPERDVFQWDSTDSVVNAIRQAGAEPLLILARTPAWAAREPDAGDASPPGELADWENFVREAVRRYGSAGRNQVQHWEIWNEPDIPQFWMGTADDYVELLNAAHDVIRVEDPGARVWGPSTTTGSRAMAFVQETLIRGRLDVFSFHRYAQVEQIHNAVRQARELLTQHGRHELKLALTETNLPGPATGGCGYTGMTEQQQADILVQMYACTATAGADHVFRFPVADMPDCPNGILTPRPELRPKANHGRLKEMISALSP